MKQAAGDQNARNGEKEDHGVEHTFGVFPCGRIDGVPRFPQIGCVWIKLLAADMTWVAGAIRHIKVLEGKITVSVQDDGG